MKRWLGLGWLLVALAVAACGGGDDDVGGVDGGPATGDEVLDTLLELGVAVNQSPRLDDDGLPLPVDYAPMGTVATFDELDELVLIGVQPFDPEAPATLLDSRVTYFGVDENQPVSLFGPGQSEPVWADDSDPSKGFGQSTRSATAADIDGDGRDETVIVYVDRGNPAADMEITAHTIQDNEHSPPFEASTQLLALEAGVDDIAVAGGDFDGDGLHDLVVGVSTADVAKVLFVSNTGGSLAVDDAATAALTPSAAGGKMAMRIAAGNLDYDRADEVVVVLNELYAGTPDTGVARYFVYDDAGADHAVLATGRVEAVDITAFVAAVADVAVGDIDGDHVDEIVFGGLDAYTANTCVEYGILAVALDDAAHSFGDLGSRRIAHFLSDCEAFDPTLLRFAFVGAVDLDGDGADEVHLNQFVFSSWRDAAPWTDLYTIAESNLISNTGDYLDRSTMQFMTADFNGNKREDILVYQQAVGEIRLFGVRDDDSFGQQAAIPVDGANTQTPLNALLLPANIDDDSLVLRYSDVEHTVVFTEPTIIAAMAAAPCSEGIGQNVGACSTVYGRATSSTITTQEVLSVSASVTIGIKVIGGALTQSEASIKGTVKGATKTITSRAYTLTKSVAFTGGALEDSVVFTTIPFDRYVYSVVAHPDPEVVGREIEVMLPRDPITLIVEREFYNAAIPDDELQVGANVFSHTVGDLASYPSISEKNQILGARGGLENGPQSVGQGGSSTEIGLAVGEAYTDGGALELAYELAVEATGGTILGGFTVGVGKEVSLLVTSGTETSYTGSVGSIDADHFADNQYGFGLFTYVEDDEASGQQFEVINYWVQ